MMSRECIEFNEDEDLAYGGAPEGFTHITEQVEDETRWSIVKLAVIRRDSDGKCFGAIIEYGSTEYQDDEPVPTEWCEVDTIPSVTYYIKEK